MARPGADVGHGLLLLHGSAVAAERALRRGMVSVQVSELPGGWLGVTPAEPLARSAPPHDAALEVMAARPIGRGHRPALGFFAIGGHAVLTAHPEGLRAEQHWLAWQPGRGRRELADLPEITLPLLVACAGAGARASLRDLQDCVDDPSGTPLEFLVSMLRLLGLPGEQLLAHGAARDARLVEPSARSVRAFDALVARDQWAAIGGDPS